MQKGFKINLNPQISELRKRFSLPVFYVLKIKGGTVIRGNTDQFILFFEYLLNVLFENANVASFTSTDTHRTVFCLAHEYKKKKHYPFIENIPLTYGDLKFLLVWTF